MTVISVGGTTITVHNEQYAPPNTTWLLSNVALRRATAVVCVAHKRVRLDAVGIGGVGVGQLRLALPAAAVPLAGLASRSFFVGPNYHRPCIPTHVRRPCGTSMHTKSCLASTFRSRGSKTPLSLKSRRHMRYGSAVSEVSTRSAFGTSLNKRKPAL